MTAQPEALVQITRYEVSVLPEGDISRSVFTINVERRGGDRCFNAATHRTQ